MAELDPGHDLVAIRAIGDLGLQTAIDCQKTEDGRTGRIGVDQFPVDPFQDETGHHLVQRIVAGACQDVIRQSVILQILHESLLLLFAHLPVFGRRTIVPDEQGPILGRRMACALAGRVGALCGVAHRIVAGPLGVSRCLINSRLLCDRLTVGCRLPACCRLFCRSWFSSVWGCRRLAVGGRLTVGYLLAVGYRLPACCRLANSVVG